MPEKIYLDYNATTPVLPQAMEAVSRAMKEEWGNPSSGHGLGRKAAHALETARKQVAALIGAAPGEIIFTSGGTESNNMAIIGSAEALREKGRHLVTTRIEHPSVLNPFIHLLERGWEVDFAKPDSRGVVSIQAIERLFRPDTVFVSVMLANNETGALQPIKEIACACRKRGIRFHTDAAQAVGKMLVDVQDLGVDLLTVAGHKLYAPKGIGALFMRRGIRLQNILFGAGQERGLRPGTEPVPLACGLGAACSWLQDKTAGFSGQMKELREEFYSLLRQEWPDLLRFVPPERCLPNTLCVSFPGLSGPGILERAGRVLASTGAACHDRSVKVSHVLSAMEVNEEVAMGMIRLSLGYMTTREDIRLAASDILQAARSLKGERN
jgi:cysteine desulfurase